MIYNGGVYEKKIKEVLKEENIIDEKLKNCIGLDLDFISDPEKNDFRNFVKKIYICKFCNKKFDLHTAFGGHVGKTHPKESKNYKEKN